MKKLFFLGTMVMLLSSCGIHIPNTSNVNENQTQVVLSQRNYKIVKHVSGYSEQTYILGFGGLSKKSLKESAISDMIKNAELTGSQAIINTNVQFKNAFYLVASTCKAEATGIVIEFTD